MKRIYRDTRNAEIGGVCAGFANYFNIDPTLLRIIVAVATLCTFSTVLWIYIICWIIMPADDNIIDN